MRATLAACCASAGSGAARRRQSAATTTPRPRRFMCPPGAHAPASTRRHRQRVGTLRYAPTYPEVADNRVRLAAGQASRTTLEITKAGSRVLDDRRLIRQSIRGDKLSDASPKLLMVIAIASPPPPVTR